MNIITSTSFIQSRDEKKKQSSQLPTSNFKKKHQKKSATATCRTFCGIPFALQLILRHDRWMAAWCGRVGWVITPSTRGQMKGALLFRKLLEMWFLQNYIDHF